MNEPQTPVPQSNPGLWAIIKSIASAAFGVQSSKNRERDFAQGKTRHFIIGGIIFTVLFITTLVVVVRTVLKQAGM